MDFFLLLNTKEKMLVTKLLMVAIDIYSMEKKKILWKSMATVNCSVTHIFQNIFFCVQQKKKNSRGWENDGIFIFGQTVPLNCPLFYYWRSLVHILQLILAEEPLIWQYIVWIYGCVKMYNILYFCNAPRWKFPCIFVPHASKTDITDDICRSYLECNQIK